MSVFVGLLGDTFTHMMLYAAPFIAVLLLLEFGIALLGVYSQQLQVSTLAPPVKCLAGIGIVLLYFALLQDLIVGRMLQLGELKHSLGLLFKASGA
jgi:type III secretion protein T